MLKTTAIIGVALVSSGCVATPAQDVPTHRWQATHVADEIQYRNDHARCITQAGVQDATILDRQSLEFDNYRQCMNHKGYVLTAYQR